MNAIELMREEHKYVKRMLVVIRNMCSRFFNNKGLDCDDFYKVIDFIRNFADGHHHNKEEIFLFNRMVEHIEILGQKLITHGMLVEHDQGRLFVANLENAVCKYQSGDEDARLDIIANAISYTTLLYSHIDKEDNVIFSFGERQLSSDILAVIDAECYSYEIENEENRKKYIALLESLEEKYSD